MRSFIDRTWLAATVFAGLVGVFAAVVWPKVDPRGMATLSDFRALGVAGVLAALLLVPPAWGFLVARQPKVPLSRAAIVGGLCVFLSAAGPWWLNAMRWEGGPLAGRMDTAFLIVVTALSASAGGLIGAGAGIAVAMMRNRGLESPAEPQRSVPPRSTEVDSTPNRSPVISLVLPTAIFLVPCLLIAGGDDEGGGPRWLVVPPVLLFAPLVWRAMVVRAGRSTAAGGALAGLAIGALVAVGWAFTSWASSGAPPFQPGLFSFIAGAALIVIVPFSTILGAIAAVLQHWLLTKLPSSRPPASAP